MSAILLLSLFLFVSINKVTKVARMLAAKPAEVGMEAGSVMALLDGGMLGRQKSWLKVPHLASFFFFFFSSVRRFKKWPYCLVICFEGAWNKSIL